MRRLTAALMLLTLLFSLPILAETAAAPVLPAGLAGRWETSADETLCATVLLLMHNGQYRLISEGVTTEGVCTLDGDTLTLDSGGGYASVCVWDDTPSTPTGQTITFSDGTRLYRCIDIDFVDVPIWREEYSGHFSLMLMNDSRFWLNYYFIGDTHPDLPEGSAVMRLDGTEYWTVAGTWLAYEHHLLLTTVTGDVWELPFDFETGMVLDENGGHAD